MVVAFSKDWKCDFLWPQTLCFCFVLSFFVDFAVVIAFSIVSIEVVVVLVEFGSMANVVVVTFCVVYY